MSKLDTTHVPTSSPTPNTAPNTAPVAAHDRIISIFETIPSRYFDDLSFDKYRPAAPAHITGPQQSANHAHICSSPDENQSFRVEPQIDYVRATRAQMDSMLLNIGGMYMFELQHGVYATAASLRIAADYLDQLNRRWAEHVSRALDGEPAGEYEDFFT